MRIPWYICIPLPIIVTCVALYVFAKDIDTTSPPNQEEIHNSVELWKTEYPISQETVDRVKSGLKAGEEPVTPPEPKTKPEPEIKVPERVAPPEPVIDISEIQLTQVSPALDALLGQNLSTAQLFKYSEQMIQNNRFQLARIALERVIDHAKDATDEDRKVAASQIIKLISQTPLWNPDPTTRKKLNIQISLNEAYKDQSERVVKMLKDIVINASDGTVIAKVELNLIKVSTESTEEMDLPKQSSLRLSQDTPLVTFSIEKVFDINSKIPAALYYAVRSKLNLVQQRINIPNRPTDISAVDALYSYITRIAWVNATIPSTPQQADETNPAPSPTDTPE